MNPGELLIGTGTALGLGIGAGTWAWTSRTLHRLRDPDHVRAHSPAWARYTDVPELLVPGPTPGRIGLGELDGRLVANPPRRSLAVIAPTGSGKTPGVVVPTVLRWAGPALVASVKGDVLHLTYAHRARRGPVWVFDPGGVCGLPGCRWSPLQVAHNYAGAMKAAAWLAESSKVEQRGVEDQRYWDTLGEKLLAPLLFAAAATGRHITEVIRWVDYRAEDEVMAILEDLGEADALAAWTASCARAERTKASVYGTAEVILHPFGHPQVRASLTPTDGPVFSPEQLLDSGGTLYLVAPAADQQLFTPVFEALVNAVTREVERRSAAIGGHPIAPPLLVMLDEAANIAPQRRLDRTASAGAGQGEVLVSIWQDEGQIEALYGPQRARTVLANHTARMYLAGISDTTTLEGLSRLLGEHHVPHHTHNRDAGGRRSSAIALHRERLAPVEYLRQLPRGTALVVCGAHKPLRVRLRAWYEDAALRALVDPEVAAAFDAQFAADAAALHRG